MKEPDHELHSSRHPASDASFNLFLLFFLYNSLSDLFVIYVFIYLLISYLFDTIYLSINMSSRLCQQSVRK